MSLRVKRNLASVFVLAVPLFFLGVLIVSADEVVLDNGDRLTGKIVKMENNVLILETQYSKPIELQAAKIKEIRTDTPAELRLLSGELLKGKISTTKEGRLAVEPTDQKPVTTIETQQVAAINLPPVTWEGGILLGGNLQTGNTDKSSAAVAVEAMRRAEKDRTSLRYLFNYGGDNDQVTARNHFGALKYDYFLTKPFYVYLGGELLSDTFKDIDLRTTIGPGIGYQIWEDPVKALGVEAGVSYLSENRTTGPDENYWAARLAANFRYNLGQYLVFTDQVLFFPSLEDTSKYTLRNEAAITAPMGVRWALRLAYIYEYNSDPSPGIKNTDTQWILGLQYKL